mmetsp:Transcript_70848/g.140556  ORF Transcript_70848/g.140556 Transcript_70848/m.140556 type:complete len:561 (+) Transcript_70848:65-1747(+)|eukprot:CAMPEP_0172657474 /NCGR_PEP_ID=MMETSP1074-20121228/2106_1 /TAXON_ID=2916 /ORGANISM="Ceratium fusus, Strain PA161109" /LENGTH=560 /DNA_ID=CAMNT_0013472555 /DNA_START=54 /DNA_END=1736 /DNA_ORIENTATION=-
MSMPGTVTPPKGPPSETAPARPPPGKAQGKGKAPAGKAPPGKAPPGKAPPLMSRAAMGTGAPVPSGPKLRPLFWTTTRPPAKSVWTDLHPPAAFDQAQLERQFALAEARTLTRTGSRSQLHQGNEEPRKRLRVLDDRTSQNLAIAFKKLPTPECLWSVLQTLDDFPDCLPAEAVMALHAAVSEQHEPIEQLRQMCLPKEGILQLDMPERYLWVLASVPGSSARLACGSLIVGPAREINDLRLAFENLGTCCQALRSSELVRKCASTSLAIGNLLNRGTSRSNATAVVLPDSLLKLDELRGIVEDPANENARAPTLLDFLAQALVDDAGIQHFKELCPEADDLRAKARAAQMVSLEESERCCNEICAAVAKAQRGLPEVCGSPDGKLLAEKVNLIGSEADSAAKLLASVKEELTATQQWSCAKPKTKGDEWFAAWVQFLDQLSAALARAAPPKSQPAPAAQRSALKELNCDQGAATGTKTVSNAGKGQAARTKLFDDNARAEDFDIAALLAQAQQAPPAKSSSQSNSKLTADAGGQRLHVGNSTGKHVHSHEFEGKENAFR